MKKELIVRGITMNYFRKFYGPFTVKRMVNKE